VADVESMLNVDTTMTRTDFDAEPKTLTDIWADIPTQDLVYGLPPLITEVPGWEDLHPSFVLVPVADLE
jgi:hypothetical protein